MKKRVRIKSRLKKEQLSKDIGKIYAKAFKEGYMLGYKDIFALGYMSAKYSLKRLVDNQVEVIEACRKYDENDDLALLDTIGETLIDLKIIKNDGRI